MDPIIIFPPNPDGCSACHTNQGGYYMQKERHLLKVKLDSVAKANMFTSKPAGMKKIKIWALPKAA